VYACVLVARAGSCCASCHLACACSWARVLSPPSPSSSGITQVFRTLPDRFFPSALYYPRINQEAFSCRLAFCPVSLKASLLVSPVPASLVAGIMCRKSLAPSLAFSCGVLMQASATKLQFVCSLFAVCLQDRVLMQASAACLQQRSPGIEWTCHHPETHPGTLNRVCMAFGAPYAFLCNRLTCFLQSRQRL
jgi:hypothetical protein